MWMHKCNVVDQAWMSMYKTKNEDKQRIQGWASYGLNWDIHGDSYGGG